MTTVDQRAGNKNKAIIRKRVGHFLNSITPESTRSATEFRPIVVVAFVAGVLITAGIALTERGVAAWVLGAIAILIASIALHRFRRETLLLRGCATTIATITD